MKGPVRPEPVEGGRSLPLPTFALSLSKGAFALSLSKGPFPLSLSKGLRLRGYVKTS
jgi:hypothetical protein